jgi:hypothetical protein
MIAMPELNAEKPGPAPWRVPVAVDNVPETGAHVRLAADADVREAVARIAGLRDLPRLEATFDLMRHGAGGLRVAGKVLATIGQTCVVTLEPLVNEVAEDVNILFEPLVEPARNNNDDGEDAGAKEARAGDAEPLVGGQIDLGALATEFLILGVDPYPRKPGVVFQPQQDVTPDPGPFAALEALKKNGNSP